MKPMTATTTNISRRALGKGLDSLLPRTQSSSANHEEGGKPREINIELIDKNPYQTRTTFDEKQLDELTGSIKSSGVIQPILVRPMPNGRFQLIAGERRLLASKRAEKTTIPAILRIVSDEQALEMTIIENLQRADLNPMEQAHAYERLSKEFMLTQDQIAVRTGKDRSSVTNFMRLLKLPHPVQVKIETGVLSFGHAKALLALESVEEVERAAQKIVSLSLSVRQTENMIQNLLNPEMRVRRVAKAEPVMDPNVREAKDQLQRALGLKVQIEDKDGRGKVIIEYARLEDFDALMDRLTK
jgi:ParB family chromosome partitioning protein